MVVRSHEARVALESLDPEPRLLGPWILLLLTEQPSHGYGVIKRINAVGFDNVDRVVYRTLAELERDGLLSVSWDTPDVGPARKVYGITDRGEDRLASAIRSIEHPTPSPDRLAAGGEAAVEKRSKRTPGVGGAREEGEVPPEGDDELDRVRSILRPWLLLLLKEQPGHGYELIKRVNEVGFDDVDRTVYRTLASLERAGWVTVSWETPDVGPARKVYALTPQGEEGLDRSVRGLDTVMALLETLMRRYNAAATPPAFDAGGPRRRRRWRT